MELDLESDTEDLRVELLTSEETTRTRQRYKKRTMSCIDRLTDLEVHACELQTILEVKSRKLASIEDQVPDHSKLLLRLARLQDENEKLHALKGIEAEVEQLTRQQNHENELRRYYEQKFKMMTVSGGRDRTFRDELAAETHLKKTLQGEFESLKIKLIQVSEERGYIDRYINKLKIDISNSRVIAAVNRRIPSRSPTGSSMRALSKPNSVKSSPTPSARRSAKLSHVSSSKQFVPSHLRRKRKVKAVVVKSK